MSSDFVTLHGDGIVFCVTIQSPLSVRLGELTVPFVKDLVSVSQIRPNFALGVDLESIASSWRSGVVSPMTLSISEASSIGDLVMSCVIY